MAPQQEQDPGAANLLKFLETTLAQLEVASGEHDEESHARLKELRTALDVQGHTDVQRETGRLIANDEEAMAGLLESVEQQLDAVEGLLRGLNPSDDVSQLLAQSVGVWLGEHEQGPQAQAQQDGSSLLQGTGDTTSVLDQGGHSTTDSSSDAKCAASQHAEQLVGEPGSRGNDGKAKEGSSTEPEQGEAPL